jgi:hypothetical protein
MYDALDKQIRLLSKPLESLSTTWSSHIYLPYQPPATLYYAIKILRNLTLDAGGIRSSSSVLASSAVIQLPRKSAGKSVPKKSR